MQRHRHGLSFPERHRLILVGAQQRGDLCRVHRRLGSQEQLLDNVLHRAQAFVGRQLQDLQIAHVGRVGVVVAAEVVRCVAVEELSISNSLGTRPSRSMVALSPERTDSNDSLRLLTAHCQFEYGSTAWNIRWSSFTPQMSFRCGRELSPIKEGQQLRMVLYYRRGKRRQCENLH